MSVSSEEGIYSQASDILIIEPIQEQSLINERISLAEEVSITYS